MANLESKYRDMTDLAEHQTDPQSWLWGTDRPDSVLGQRWELLERRARGPQ